MTNRDERLSLTASADHTSSSRGFAEWLDRHCGPVMVLPAVIVILAFALFPLIISAYLALSRFALAPGGFTLRFIGLANFKKLLTGSQQYHLLGACGPPGFLQWALIVLVAALLLILLYRYFTRTQPTIGGTLGRLIAASTAMGLALVVIVTTAQGGVPGTIVNTLLYVV